MKNNVSMIADKLSALVTEWSLSDREMDIINLILKDITSTKAIAESLGISPITVRNHLEKIYKKSNCKNKSTLIVNILHRYMEENTNLTLFYRQPKVLIVDDEEYICDVLETTLSEKGIKAYTTTKPTEVKNLIKKIPFDFIISDIRMPELNGHDLIKEIKSQHYYWPRVIVMTGYSEFSPEELYHQGAISYLTKPFKPDRIFNIILENYSDELNPVQNILNNLDESEVHSLPDHFQLKVENLGTGGAFIELPVETLRQKEFSQENYIDLRFSVKELGGDLLKSRAQIMWRRLSQEDGLKPGIGVKFFNEDLVKSDLYLDLMMKNEIVSFIPIT